MANYKILSDAEIRAALADLPDWSVKAPNIEAKFALKTFRDAIACIVEHGGHGASSAGLVVRAVLQRYFELHPPQNVPGSVLTNLNSNKPAHPDVGVVEE